MEADWYESKIGLDRPCPLCGSSRTRFVDSWSDGDEIIERGFNSQQCSNQGCGLPCRLWDKVESLKKEVKHVS
jgi:hypothetical protein